MGKKVKSKGMQSKKNLAEKTKKGTKSKQVVETVKNTGRKR